MKKKSFFSRVGDFLLGKGFYMVLLLCIMAIGGSGYYLYHLADMTLSTADQPVSAPAQVEVETPASLTPEAAQEVTDAMREAQEIARAAQEEQAAAEETAKEVPAETVEPAKTAESAEPEQAEETAAETPVQETAAFTAPVEGEAVAAFSDTELTYNAAMGDWRTHNGVDLSANLGDEVHAAMAGEVLSVQDDLLLGTTVTLNHGDGIMTVYGNLDPEVTVRQGDRVSAGQVIGTVGESANGETHEGAWLHFAVRKDGELVDPMEYLGES